jgi:hypothetical protein
MPGLVPGIHVLKIRVKKTWMAGTSPAMTSRGKLMTAVTQSSGHERNLVRLDQRATALVERAERFVAGHGGDQVIKIPLAF